MITRQSQPVQTNLHAGIAARCRLKNGFALDRRTVKRITAVNPKFVAVLSMFSVL